MVTATAKTAAHVPALTGPEALIGIGVLVVLVIGYRVSLWVHPLTTCRVCGGEGKVSGLFGGRRFCRRCHGRGLVPRLGTRLLAGGRTRRDTRSWQ
jgi:hypothetical protein